MLADKPHLCPLCLGGMRLKDGVYGKFWSCLKFPDCTGAITAKGTNMRRFTWCKRDGIKELIKENPAVDNNKIATLFQMKYEKAVSTSHVNNVRRAMEKSGEFTSEATRNLPKTRNSPAWCKRYEVEDLIAENPEANNKKIARLFRENIKKEVSVNYVGKIRLQMKRIIESKSKKKKPLTD